jgi:hypothetical protein
MPTEADESSTSSPAWAVFEKGFGVVLLIGIALFGAAATRPIIDKPVLTIGIVLMIVGGVGAIYAAVKNGRVGGGGSTVSVKVAPSEEDIHRVVEEREKAKVKSALVQLKAWREELHDLCLASDPCIKAAAQSAEWPEGLDCTEWMGGLMKLRIAMPAYVTDHIGKGEADALMDLSAMISSSSVPNHEPGKLRVLNEAYSGQEYIKNIDKLVAQLERRIGP